MQHQRDVVLMGSAYFTICITDSRRPRTQLNKEAAKAFEISQARSMTQFVKFSVAGRRATSWGHVQHRSLHCWFRDEAGDGAGHSKQTGTALGQKRLAR